MSGIYLTHSKQGLRCLHLGAKRVSTLTLFRYYVSPSQSRSTIYAPSQAEQSSLAPSAHTVTPPKPASASALSILPLSVVLRTYLITACSSSPMLLRLCVSILGRISQSESLLLSSERNRVLRWLLKRTFYAQFCAGENRREVTQTLAELKSLGYTGVMLEYALEVCSETERADAAQTTREIANWRKGVLQSIQAVEPGDFVALKWSGLGSNALELLNSGQPPTAEMLCAITEICDLAASKDVAMIPSAELARTNVGVDAWTLDLQRRYNKRPDGTAIMYTTYQTYLKSAPARLARDLAAARREGFTLGVKLVRGAYLDSEVKSELCESKAATDRQYDGMAEAVLRRRYDDTVRYSASGTLTEFPLVNVVIACHNEVSIQKSKAIIDEQVSSGKDSPLCTFVQLQGMADELSCKLLQASQTSIRSGSAITDRLRTYKFVSWGSLPECLQYLMRRAAENQDAAGRTADTRKAMGQEIWRRLRATFGIS